MKHALALTISVLFIIRIDLVRKPRVCSLFYKVKLPIVKASQLKCRLVKIHSNGTASVLTLHNVCREV